MASHAVSFAASAEPKSRRASRAPRASVSARGGVGARVRSARRLAASASSDNASQPSWEELIERKVDEDMRADIRDDMWGWEPTKERVLLVGVGGQRGDERADEYGMEASLEELGQLAETAGLEVVGTLTQRLRAPHPGTYIGKGKLAELRRACGLPTREELAAAERAADEEDEWFEEEDAPRTDAADDDAATVEDPDDDSWGERWDEESESKSERVMRRELEASNEPTVDTVVFDSELTPRQARNLSKVLDDKVQICDRTMLILDIFSQRARTAEGQLQVEMAQLEYQLPRLTRMWTHLERQAGGAGGSGRVKGMGEKQIEIDKRLLRDRIVLLRRKLDKVKTHRELYRGRRAEAPVPVVSLVGYTNAGKSSLLNRLTAAGVLSEDQLFATLDPTTRRLPLANGKDVLVTDTVGFIQRLPTNLVAAFRATLEEIRDSTLLLHVVDASSPLAGAQVAAVEAVLRDLGAEDIPRVTVWNKVDAMDEDADADVDVDVDARDSGGGKIPDAAEETSETGIEPVTRDDVASAARAAGAVAVSARTGFGVDELVATVQRELVRVSLVRVELTVPYTEGSVLGEIRKAGVIEEEAYDEVGTRVVAHVPFPMARRLQSRGFATPRDAKADAKAEAEAGADASAEEWVTGDANWSEEEEEELTRMLMEEEAAAAAAEAAFAAALEVE